MKTAVSLPDAVFEAAERLAKRRGMSRSELYAQAIAQYVQAERSMGVRERLDAIYRADPDASRLDAALEKLQSLSSGESSPEEDSW